MKTFDEELARKYGDKVTPEHTAAMQAIGLFHAMIGQHRETMQKLIDSDQYMQNVGALIDPTLYRDALYSKNFKQQLRLVKAALGRGQHLPTEDGHELRNGVHGGALRVGGPDTGLRTASRSPLVPLWA